MTDRQRRLHRALVELSWAMGLLDDAAVQVEACIPARAETADRLVRRVRWMRRVVVRELGRLEAQERAEAKEDT